MKEIKVIFEGTAFQIVKYLAEHPELQQRNIEIRQKPEPEEEDDRQVD